MDFCIESFIAGINDRLDFAKQADIFDQSHKTFFPNSDKQSTWRYSLKEDRLHLHDGHNTFSFSFPKELGEESEMSERLEDSNKFDYETNATSKGTAQVHRSNPGYIYVTLHDGHRNPTFTLQHESANKWKIIPKKKLKKMLSNTSTLTTIVPESFMEGATKEADYFDQSVDAFANTTGPVLDTMGQGMQSLGAGIAAHPLLAGAGVLGGAYLLNKWLNNHKNTSLAREAVRATPSALMLASQGLGGNQFNPAI